MELHNAPIPMTKDRSYNKGYIAGYQRGIEDSKSGLVNSFSDSDLLTKPLPFLNLTKRPFNSLDHAGYRTVGDIVFLKKEEIWKIRNLGRKGLHEIAWSLWDHGIRDSEWNEWLYAD